MNKYILLLLTLLIMINSGFSEEMPIQVSEVASFVNYLNSNHEESVWVTQEKFSIQKNPCFLRTLCEYLDGPELRHVIDSLGCIVAINMQLYPEADVGRFAKCVYGKWDLHFSDNIYLYYAIMRYFGKSKFNSLLHSVYQEYGAFVPFYISFREIRLPYIDDILRDAMKNKPASLGQILEKKIEIGRAHRALSSVSTDVLHDLLVNKELKDNANELLSLELLMRGDLKQIQALPVRAYLMMYYEKVPDSFKCGFEILFDSYDDFIANARRSGEIQKRLEQYNIQHIYEMPIKCIQSTYPNVESWSVKYLKEISAFLDSNDRLLRSYRWTLQVDYRDYLTDESSRIYLEQLSNCRRTPKITLPVSENTMNELMELIDLPFGWDILLVDSMCRNGFMPVSLVELHPPWASEPKSTSITQNMVAFYVIFKDLLCWNEKRLCYEWANGLPQELRMVE